MPLFSAEPYPHSLPWARRPRSENYIFKSNPAWLGAHFSFLQIKIYLEHIYPHLPTYHLELLSLHDGRIKWLPDYTMY